MPSVGAWAAVSVDEDPLASLACSSEDAEDVAALPQAAPMHEAALPKAAAPSHAGSSDGPMVEAVGGSEQACHVVPSPQAAAGVKVTKSLARRSARRRGRLPGTAAGSGLPRGSASVVHQLGGMGTRNWSRRGRQVARREALRADAGNKERSPREKEARAWRVPHKREPHIDCGEEGRKRPDVRSRKRSRPWSFWRRSKSQHQPPAHQCRSKRGMSFESCGFQMRMLCHG